MRPHRIRSPRRGGSPRRPGPPVRGGAARGRDRGLNLVEIVLVIAILSLLSAIAVPRYGNSIMRYRAESAARRVAQDLALAQAHAANAGRPQAVVFVARGYQMPGMPHLNGKGYGDYTVDLGTDAYGVTRVAVDTGWLDSSVTTTCSASTADSRSWMVTGRASDTVSDWTTPWNGGASARRE